MDSLLDNVMIQKSKMLSARIQADQAAASYRASVRIAVEKWRAGGLSLRKSADRLGITEGALRDLLRPEGASRRARKKKASINVKIQD